MIEVDNIVLISIDDLRFDCVGYEEDKRLIRKYDPDSLIDTPTLDSLAKKGVSFGQCVSTSSYTPPSHASMFTGMYPKHHGAKTFLNRLSRNVVTLAEILACKGFKTHAWIENSTLEMLDITRGIRYIEEPFRNHNSDLFDFLGRIKKGKNFIFVHLFDVHKPYGYTTGGNERERYNDDYLTMIEEITGKYDISMEELLGEAKTEARRVVENYDTLNSSAKEYADYRSLDFLLRKRLRELNVLFDNIIPLYMKGVSKFDQGKFNDLINRIDEICSLENSLLIITSDHGETRCKWNGREDFMNSFNLLEGSVRVPLIIYAPTIFPSGVRIKAPVSLIDITPTVLDLVDIRMSNRFDGKSLVTLIMGKSKNLGGRLIFNEAWAYEGGIDIFGNEKRKGKIYLSQVSARSTRFKYIRSFFQTDYPKRMLFDHVKDLYEKVNLVDNPLYKYVGERLEKEIDEYMRNVVTYRSFSDNDKKKIKDQLKVLGYF